MTTVVQSNYRPTIAPAVAGMIADEAGWEVGTKQCETVAGIGFGLAVSQGTADGGAVIGGSAFIGVSVRDVTLDGAPIDPLSDTRGTTDVYPQRANMGVLSRGHIWVTAHANVAAGNALYYDTTNGTFTNSASGAAASGSLTFVGQPADEATIVVNAKTITFKDSGATGLQSNIGATIAETVDNLVAMLNASSDTAIDDCTYAAYPPGAGNMVLIGCDTVGEAGNSITISSGTAAVVASGATLAGGTAAATAVTGGYWLSSAVAHNLAKISLGVQR